MFCDGPPVRKFQSTPSAWRETIRLLDRPLIDAISIHSLRMEGDMRPSPALPWYGYFNPLPPHGGRLSHPPRCPKLNNISIHSLRMEGDPCTFHPPASQKRFQSTPSAWWETFDRGLTSATVCHFNPLPPHGGRPFSVKL